jgi:hypothetical protein
METTALRPLKRSESTPWGVADSTTKLADGVHHHITSSHGGYQVLSHVREKWPQPLRDFEPFAGRGWYEEDCDWAIVALAMPHLFPDEAADHARRAITYHHKELAAALGL